MSIAEMLLPEFDREMETARKTLERIPEDRLDWTPHKKSMPLGRLAGHIAELAGWASEVIDKDSLDLSPPNQPPYQPVIVRSRQHVLQMFDEARARGHAAIASASDEHLMKNWSLLRTGKALITMPRTMVLRSFCLNHIIHHRAQLGVYLRLNDIPVPSVYGPSADEGTLG